MESRFEESKGNRRVDSRDFDDSRYGDKFNVKDQYGSKSKENIRHVNKSVEKGFNEYENEAKKSQAEFRRLV